MRPRVQSPASPKRILNFIGSKIVKTGVLLFLVLVQGKEQGGCSWICPITLIQFMGLVKNRSCTIIFHHGGIFTTSPMFVSIRVAEKVFHRYDVDTTPMVRCAGHPMPLSICLLNKASGTRTCLHHRGWVV